ncbi:MAG: GFA family protein [Sphingomonadales bacterium]|nr:GFA family protein [Sphingomonadales bacterium]
MTDKPFHPLEGGCDCGRVRYRLESPPMFVHCCHCRWCQRETGASFALNALIEADRVTLLREPPELIDTPSESGDGQMIARCPVCRIAVWSHYRSAGPFISFIRVGSLDDPDRLPPNIHIFTASKQPWVALPPDAVAVPAFYEREKYWPPESLKRRAALMPKINAYHAAKAAQTPI